MRHSLQSEKLHHKIAALENLPTLPAIAVELVRRWNDPDLSIRSITDILSKDPSVAAKVLQVANSASFGLRKKVTSLSHAAALLGLNSLRCVTLGVTVFQSFSGRRADWAEKMDLDEFWRHSLAVGVAAEMLAVRWGWTSPEEAFLAGLLHDIGKIGLLATVPGVYVETVEKASSGARSLVEYESDTLMVTHSEVGKWIAERWGFPDVFRDAVWLHHRTPGSEPVAPGELWKLVYLADHLVRRARIGDAGNRYFLHDDLWLLGRLGMDEAGLSQFTGDMLLRTQSVGEMLDLPIPTVDIYLKALGEANRHLAKGALDADRELKSALRSADVLRMVSEITQMPVGEDLEVDLLARSIELIQSRFDLRWILVMTRDAGLGTLEGAVLKPGMAKPQTFYRVLDPSEKGNESAKGRRSGFLDLLGETVLSNGERVNLRDEVLKVLEEGQLVAVPLEVDKSYRGECLVDTMGSKVVDVDSRLGLDAAIEAIAGLQERARLHRNLNREMEASAESARREAEALRQIFHIERLASVGRLAAGAAHEINNPLAVISGKAQLLLIDEKAEKRAKTLNDIVGQTERISKIISDLMGFARPTQPSVTDAHLSKLVESALQMAHHRMPLSEVVAEIEVPKDLPTIRVDGKQIEQVLVNLFVNAIQAMQNHGKLSIRASHLKGAGMVSIQVIDTGPGIPVGDLPKIFDPFFTTKREGEGTGLGLAVSQRIVEIHGGSLWVTSHQGQGTIFTLQLPCGGGEETPAPVRQQAAVAARRPAKKHLLLVDDEKPLSDLIRDFLTNAGYAVDQASDGIEALEAMDKGHYDALIMDLRMPRKDGLEVLEELQETTPGIPTLIITGLATNEELDHAIECGANRVLRKPFQLDDLLHGVREILREL